MRALGLGFTNHVGTAGVLGVCLCLGYGGVSGVGGEWIGGLDQGLDGCYICVRCESGLCVDDRSRYLHIVLGGYLRILGAPSVQSCST